MWYTKDLMQCSSQSFSAEWLANEGKDTESRSRPSQMIQSGWKIDKLSNKKNTLAFPHQPWPLKACKRSGSNTITVSHSSGLLTAMVLEATEEQKQNQETPLSKTQLEEFKHCLMEWCTVLCNCWFDKEQAVTAHIFSLELLPNWVILWGRTESAVHLQKLSPGECERVKYFYSLKKLLVLIVSIHTQPRKVEYLCVQIWYANLLLLDSIS